MTRTLVVGGAAAALAIAGAFHTLYEPSEHLGSEVVRTASALSAMGPGGPTTTMTDPIIDDVGSDSPGVVTTTRPAAVDVVEEPLPIDVSPPVTTVPPAPRAPEAPPIPGEPIPVQADDDDEIEIDPSVDPPDTDADPVLSEDAAIACGGLEVAIEAARAKDWPRFEEVVYRTAPIASGAEEIEIARLATPLFGLLSSSAPGDELNEMMNVCVEQGYEL